jgi:hypothetical protein
MYSDQRVVMQECVRKQTSIRATQFSLTYAAEVASEPAGRVTSETTYEINENPRQGEVMHVAEELENPKPASPLQTFSCQVVTATRCPRPQTQVAVSYQTNARYS